MITEIHLSPRYYGYKIGNYTNIKQCPRCKLTGLYEDMGLVCINCGNPIVEIESRKWVPPVKKLTINFWYCIPYMKKLIVVPGKWVKYEEQIE